jgi:hypothetical protein
MSYATTPARDPHIDAYREWQECEELDHKLKDLAEYPERLTYSRARFCYSPPLQSPTTVIGSPTNDERINSRLDERRRLINRYERSLPNKQFQEQVDKAKRTRAGGEDAVVGAVKAGWVKQGIWNSSWDETRVGDTRWYWRHEARPGPDGRQVQSGFVQAQGPEDSNSISRPFAQFIYQLQEELQKLHDSRIQSLSRGEIIHDMSTNAYYKVTKDWEERQIWYNRWGLLPGATWIHELPREAWLKEEMGENYLRLNEDGEFMYDVPPRPAPATDATFHPNPAGWIGGLLKSAPGGVTGFSHFAGSGGGLGFAKLSDQNMPSSARPVPPPAVTGGPTADAAPEGSMGQRARPRIVESAEDQGHSNVPRPTAKVTKVSKKRSAQEQEGASRGEQSQRPLRRSPRLRELAAKMGRE